MSRLVDPGALLRVTAVVYSLAAAMPAVSLAQDEGLQFLPDLGNDNGLDQGVGGERTDEEGQRDETSQGTPEPDGGGAGDVVPVAGENTGTSLSGAEGSAVPAAAPAEDVALSGSVQAEGAAGAAEPGASSLLGYLEEREEARPPPAPPVPAEVDGTAALFGCPRAVLQGLLSEATVKADVVSSLEIEREVLTLCGERQRLVVEVLTAEAEIGRLWRESRAPEDAPARPEPVFENVLAQLTEFEGAPVVEFVEEPVAPDPEPEPEPEPEPVYSWFSIFGTAGDLQAGVSDGTEVWFVRERDVLPGGVVIDWIGARPPGVHVMIGADDATLPYRPVGRRDG